MTQYFCMYYSFLTTHKCIYINYRYANLVGIAEMNTREKDYVRNMGMPPGHVRFTCRTSSMCNTWNNVSWNALPVGFQKGLILVNIKV